MSEFWNFYKLKRGEKISGGNDFHRKSELFGPPFCISILKILQTQILWHSLYFNAFCLIQQYFFRSFGVFRKRGDLISAGKQIYRKSELFGPPFYFLILKVLWTQILHHSLDFNAFCMIQRKFSQSFEISTN